MTLAVPPATTKPDEHDVPDSGGLVVAVSVRPVQALGIADGMLPKGARSVRIFLVNRRVLLRASESWDEHFIFRRPVRPVWTNR